VFHSSNPPLLCIHHLFLDIPPTRTGLNKHANRAAIKILLRTPLYLSEFTSYLSNGIVAINYFRKWELSDACAVQVQGFSPRSVQGYVLCAPGMSKKLVKT
jgi:hypothetical protein